MDMKSKRNWGLFVAGLALLIIGFVLTMAPGITLVSIAAIAGVMFLVAGVLDGIAYFRYHKEEGLSGWMLAYAVCDILLGLFFIIHPIVSAVIIPWAMGIVVTGYGLFGIYAAIQAKRAGVSWGWLLFSAVVSVLCGLTFFFVPSSFALFLGLFLMVRGVQMAVYGVSIPTPVNPVAHTH